MPKLKTKKSAAKRIKVSGTGKLMRRKQNKRHILTKKSSKRKRHLGQVTQISAAETKKITRLLIAGM